jgi:hypothetical protein
VRKAVRLIERMASLDEMAVHGFGIIGNALRLQCLDSSRAEIK